MDDLWPPPGRSLEHAPACLRLTGFFGANTAAPGAGFDRIRGAGPQDDLRGDVGFRKVRVGLGLGLNWLRDCRIAAVLRVKKKLILMRATERINRALQSHFGWPTSVAEDRNVTPSICIAPCQV